MTTSGNSNNLVAKVVDGQTLWGNYNNDGSCRSQDDTTYVTPRARSSCHGTFEAIPMSGDARKYDQGQSAVWWFTPGAGTTHCDVAVYLPNSEPPADSDATAAQFFVTAGRGGGRLASFVLDQSISRTTRRGMLPRGSTTATRGYTARTAS